MRYRNHSFLGIIIFLFLFGVLDAQSPSIQWQKSFGGSSDEKAYSVCVTSDNGYAILGTTYSTDGDITDHHLVSPSGDNFWLIKLDSLGVMTWNKCYGGGNFDVAHSIKGNFTGGFVLSGTTGSSDGDVSGIHGLLSLYDYWVVTTNSSGIMQWQICLGGSEMDEQSQIIECVDSGYLVVGNTLSNDFDVAGNHGSDDIWVVKLDKSGVKQWAKTLGGSLGDYGISCAQSTDGNFLIAGSTTSFDGDVTGLHNNSEDVWIVKLNTNHQIIWQKCYGGSSGDFPNQILATSDGGFIVSATTYSNDGDVSGSHGSAEFWLFKCDSTGTMLWQKCIGGNSFESSDNAVITSDGGIIMAGIAVLDNGMVTGTHGMDDFWVVKVDSLGNFAWGKCLGGTDQEDANSVIETPDRGYIVVGSTQSHDGDITFNHGNKDFWVVKLSPAPVSVPELESTLMDLNIFQNNDVLSLRYFSKQNDKLQINIYNVNGKMVLEEGFLATEGINYNHINCSGLAKGMYLVKIDGSRSSQAENVIIQ